jgi:hypothetical protein
MSDRVYREVGGVAVVEVIGRRYWRLEDRIRVSYARRALELGAQYALFERNLTRVSNVLPLTAST